MQYIVQYLSLDYLYSNNFNTIIKAFQTDIGISMNFRRKIAIRKINISFVRDLLKNTYINCDLTSLAAYFIKKSLGSTYKYIDILCALFRDSRVDLYSTYFKIDMFKTCKIPRNIFVLDLSKVVSIFKYNLFVARSAVNTHIIFTLKNHKLSLLLTILYDRSGDPNIFRKNRMFMNSLLQRINIDIVTGLFNQCFNDQEKNVYLKNAFKKNDIRVISYIVKYGNLNLFELKYKSLIDNYLAKYSYFRLSEDPEIKSTLYSLIEISEILSNTFSVQLELFK